jgi:hypothetical protein
VIVPLSSPDNTDLTVWVARCDHCGFQRSVNEITDWTLFEGSEAEVDAHFCPRCTKRIARHLIGSAFPRHRVPLGLAVTALIAVGVLALRRPTKGA